MQSDSGTEELGGSSVQRIIRRRPTGVFKTLNAYATAVPEYRDIPKAVWAAIAVSALTCGGDHLAEARERVRNEWRVLHENGIVPQKPPNEKVS